MFTPNVSADINTAQMQLEGWTPYAIFTLRGTFSMSLTLVAEPTAPQLSFQMIVYGEF